MKALLIKNRFQFCGLIAICVLILAGCDSVTNADKTVSSDLESTTISDQSVNNGRWIHNVSGGGKDFYPGEDDEATFEITFNAKIDADGNVNGRVKWSLLDGTVVSAGSVQCLEVRDNRAYMIYMTEEGYISIGDLVAIAFEDNGEGSNAEEVDRHSYIYGWGLDCISWADYVDNNPVPHMVVDWPKGNVQVR